PLVGELALDRLADDPLRLLGVPLHAAGGVGHLAAPLPDALAHLGRHGLGELILALVHHVGQALLERRPLVRRRQAPRLERLVRHVRRAPRLVGAAIGDAGDDLTGRRAPHLERGAGALPLPAQVPRADVLGSAHGGGLLAAAAQLVGAAGSSRSPTLKVSLAAPYASHLADRTAAPSSMRPRRSSRASQSQVVRRHTSCRAHSVGRALASSTNPASLRKPAVSTTASR